MEAEEHSRALLGDISNLKTPKPSIQNPNFPSSSSSPFPLFTASKQTPVSNFRHRLSTVYASANRSRARAVRRLKAFEIEQSQSSRRAQVRREKSLRSLEKSLSVWLNFLFKNPRSCGCELAVWNGDQPDPAPDSAFPAANGKRESLQGGRLWIDGAWRNPKRQKNRTWRGSSGVDLKSVEFSSLQVSMQDVCSLEDLKQRMGMYLGANEVKEVLCVMSQVAKNIDDGRLKIKGHCPIVTDVALKEKAIRTLMCYNSTWLRIGLHIVFGGDSILPRDLTAEKGESDFNAEDLLLKMIIEKQFFSHAGLARSYAYNKSVEGLYRPGYYEALGNLILKRFLLFVLSLDKAKCQSTLPTRYGIDSLDGGSPLLFYPDSSIKSSRQVIHEFLSEVMHGEGDLLAHLAILGYKVTHQQFPLAEYDFSVTDLGKDLRDGVRLCRAVQLLLNDTSILVKLVVPSDSHKKNLANCGVAIQYLKQAGMPLIDEDGDSIVAEDVVNGDKELTLSLLWNLFVHSQVPLLINRSLLNEELSKAKGSADVDQSRSKTGGLMDLLLEWIQEICENYHVMVDSFSSLVDGKALCCLVDYYFRNELHDDCFCKEAQDNNGKESVIISTDNTVVLRNFKLVQRVAKALGNFPEVLQISDILDQDIACNERSVIILLSFLSSQLIGRKNLDQLNLTKLVGWSHWSPDMKPGATAHASDHASNSDLLNVFSSQETHIFSFAERVDQVQVNANTFPDAVPKIKVIQAWWRALAKRKEYLKIKFAASIIQGNVRCQLAHKHINERRREMAAKVIQSHFRGSIEHHSFIKMKAAASFLQIVIRAWLKVVSKKSCSKFCQNYLGHLTSGGETSGIFERYLKCMIERRNFIRMQKSVLFIQRTARTWISQRRQMEKIEKLLREKKLLENLIEAEVNQCFAVTKIQSCWRGCLMRKDFLCQRTAIIIIQSWLRSLQYLKEFKKYKSAAIEIQRCARGMIARTRLLGDPYLCVSHLDNHSQDHSSSRCTKQVEVKHLQHSVLKLQRWWKRVLASRLRTRATIIIQSHTRGWITRREFQRERHHIVVIQSYWKGYLARKDHQELRDQLLDLRHRMQKSAVNVDNGMRLINRLVAALDELLSYKRLTSTLRTCQTLDMATEHSQKCCETLVAAGAIDTLLKLIRTVSRSIPDQEVSKHSLSTLRNLARYRHLVEMLIDTHGSVEIIFRELLRNKEMYFIAADLLKKLCLLKKGVEALRNCPLLVKRLRNLVQDLERKASMGKRNARLCAATYDFEQRLRVASELFQLVMKAMKA